MYELAEKCGVFGIYGKGLDVSRLTFYALFALQHRGQESSGTAVSDGKEIDCYKNEGLVARVYDERIIRSLRGHIAIGHNRYSTSGGIGLHHAQPIVVNSEIALAHNGNLPSVSALLDFLRSKNLDVSGCSDSELITYAIWWHIDQGKSAEEAVREAYPLFTGAFSVVALTKHSLLAFRDQCGIRPLVIGALNGGYVFASETCALNLIAAEFIREVNPGELVIVDEQGLRSVQVVPSNPKIDVFEFVYFARPDSIICGKSIYEVRRNLGAELANEHPIEADLVIPVPETAIPAALAYSRVLGVPLEMALVKNRYVHRTFIQPEQHIRELGVKMKLVPLPGVLNKKRVIVIDDSIVRGTTSRQLIKVLFEAGAREVHMLVCSPPVRFPDFYGIDTPKQRQLIAAEKSIEQIREYIGSDSLHYLSLKGLIKSTGLPKDTLSTSCFTGEYPIDLYERSSEVNIKG